MASMDRGVYNTSKASVSLIISLCFMDYFTFCFETDSQVSHPHNWTCCFHLLKYSTFCSFYCLSRGRKRICNHKSMDGTMKALKPIDGNRRPWDDFSTVREVTVSALGKSYFWLHAGFFYLLWLSEGIKEPGLLTSQNNLLQREPDRNPSWNHTSLNDIT